MRIYWAKNCNSWYLKNYLRIPFSKEQGYLAFLGFVINYKFTYIKKL